MMLPKDFFHDHQKKGKVKNTYFLTVMLLSRALWGPGQGGLFVSQFL